MDTLKKTWRAISDTMLYLIRQGWFRLYLACWLASFLYLMIFEVQWEDLRREGASLEYLIGAYYAGAVIFSAFVAVAMGLIFTGVLLGAYYFFLDMPQRKEKRTA